MYRDQPASAPLAIVAFGGNVVGMDRMSGKRVWTWDYAGGLWKRLVVTDDRVYVFGMSRIACLEYATGKPLWNVTTEARTETVVIDGAQLLVGGGGQVACYSAADGRFLWHDEFKGMGLGDVSLGFPHNTQHADMSG